MAALDPGELTYYRIAELYFTDTLWPDFTAADFELALQHYASCQRRFGLIGAQVGS